MSLKLKLAASTKRTDERHESSPFQLANQGHKLVASKPAKPGKSREEDAGRVRQDAQETFIAKHRPNSQTDGVRAGARLDINN